VKGFSVVSWIKQSIISVLILGVIDLIFNYIETKKLVFTNLNWSLILFVLVFFFVVEIPAVKKIFNKQFFNKQK
jgi:hypothetical protein